MTELRERGFLPAHVKVAQGLMAALTRAAPPRTRDLAAYRAAIRKAEDELWDYYLEWSQLARAVIHDAQLLERLGYRGGQTGEDEEPDISGSGEPPAAQQAAPRSPNAAKPQPRRAAKPRKVVA